uniref:Dentin sialophosphoprotein-like n=1 Tax=Phallusia mammillata TaxID=59560 RepID=A0A6F9DC54_9ASCI|nr:dentin sialophosphoprotein-like [Phallusia mammillata]
MFSPRPRRLRRKPKSRRVLKDITSVAEYERVYVSRQRTLMQKAFELEEATGALITVTVRSSSSGDVAYFASNDELIQKLKNGDLIKNDSHRFTQQYFCSASTFNMSGLQSLLQRTQDLAATSNTINSNNNQPSPVSNQNSERQNTRTLLNTLLNTSHQTGTPFSPPTPRRVTQPIPSVAVVDPVPKLNQESPKSSGNQQKVMNSTPKVNNAGSASKKGKSGNNKPSAAKVKRVSKTPPTKPVKGPPTKRPKQSPNQESKTASRPRPTFLSPKSATNQNSNLTRNGPSSSGVIRKTPELSLDINVEIEAAKQPLANHQRVAKPASSSSSESDDSESSDSSSSEDGDENETQSSDSSDTGTSESNSSSGTESVLETPASELKPFVVNPSPSILPTPSLFAKVEKSPPRNFASTNVDSNNNPYDFVDALASKRKNKHAQLVHHSDKTKQPCVPPKDKPDRSDTTQHKSPVAIAKQETPPDTDLQHQVFNRSTKGNQRRSKSAQPPSVDLNQSPMRNLTLQRKSTTCRTPPHPKHSAVHYYNARRKNKLEMLKQLSEAPKSLKPLGLVNRNPASERNVSPPEVHQKKRSEDKIPRLSLSKEWRYFNSTFSNNTTVLNNRPLKTPLLETPTIPPMPDENARTRKRSYSAPADKLREPQQRGLPIKRERQTTDESSSSKTRKLDSQRLLLRCRTFIERTVSTVDFLKGDKYYPLKKIIENDRFHHIKLDIVEHLGPRGDIIRFMAESLKTSKFLDHFEHTHVRRYQPRPPVHKRRQNNTRPSVQQVSCMT